ncbi:hypothetical protein M8994_19070 [Brucella sp. 21LCYQ03]|nr:hypothetical protein [Brucella sp. 21LCYQ03]
MIDLIHHVFFICKRGRNLGIYLACQARTTNVGTVLHLMQPGFGYHSQPSKETTANAAFNILQKAVMRLSVAAFEVDA